VKLACEEFPSVTVEVEDVCCPGCSSSNYEPLTESQDFDYFITDVVFRIVQCPECNLIYVNPRPSLKEIEKIYPEEYSAYHFSDIKNPIIRKARSFMQVAKARKILKCIPRVDNNMHIVDVGCGSPVLLNLLREIAPGEINLYGNDFNPKALELVKRMGFETIPGNFEDVEWENNFFDMIVMNQLIEHLFDIPGVLRKSFSLLKPNGALLIETPSADGLDSRLFRKYHWGGYHVPRHLQIFTSETISTTLSKYGFEVETISYLPSPNFWTSSFRNLLFIKGFPRFITKRMNYKNVFCMTLFTSLDLLTRNFSPTSNMRVVAKKPG